MRRGSWRPPAKKRLGDWQGMWGFASVGRRLGSAAQQVETEEKGAAGWCALLSTGKLTDTYLEFFLLH